MKVLVSFYLSPKGQIAAAQAGICAAKAQTIALECDTWDPLYQIDASGTVTLDVRSFKTETYYSRTIEWDTIPDQNWRSSYVSLFTEAIRKLDEENEAKEAKKIAAEKEAKEEKLKAEEYKRARERIRENDKIEFRRMESLWDGLNITNLSDMRKWYMEITKPYGNSDYADELRGFSCGSGKASVRYLNAEVSKWIKELEAFEKYRCSERVLLLWKNRFAWETPAIEEWVKSVLPFGFADEEPEGEVFERRLPSLKELQDLEYWQQRINGVMPDVKGTKRENTHTHWNSCFKTEDLSSVCLKWHKADGGHDFAVLVLELRAFSSRPDIYFTYSPE